MARAIAPRRRLARRKEEATMGRHEPKTRGRKRVHRSTAAALATSIGCIGATTAAHADVQAAHECIIAPQVVVDVGSAVPGVIESLELERGDAVEVGQVLARLHSGVERAGLEVARARAGITTDVRIREVALEFQRRTRQRTDELYRQKSVPATVMDEAERDAAISALGVRRAREERQLATLELERAREVLDRRTIRSPVSGVVTERFRAAGEYVEDQPLVRVAQLDPLRVQVVLPTSSYGEVRTGMVADVTPELEALGTHEALVVSVDRVIDAASGTFRVELELPNPGDALPAGLRCTLRFDSRAPRSAPAEAAVPQSPLATPEAIDRAGRPAGDAPAKPEPVALSDTAGTCHSVGPFGTAREAEAFAERLGVPGTQAAAREIAATQTTGYLALLATEATTRPVQELIRDLKAKGLVDVAPLRAGPHAGSVSLGYFVRLRSAMTRMAELTQLGVDAVLLAQERETTAHWLDLTHHGGALDPQRLHEAARGRGTVTVRSCTELVASRR
jgi:RND family efflux transporter MFP subunit